MEGLAQAGERDQKEGVAVGGTPKTKGEKEKKKKKKTKEDKDKNGQVLKKPLSAYMLFNNHRRPIIKKEHPGNYW